jgi:putative membrane protein
MLLQSLEGLPAFIAYFCLAAVLVVVFLLIYTRITPMNEFELIRKNVPGAAIALGLSLFGFTLPLASAIAHASDLIDCAIWGVVALIVQIVTFYAVRIPVPDLSNRIAAGDVAPAIWLGLASLTAGLLSAASMTL